MNKQRIFHMGLFREGVRQTRLIGLGGLVITMLFTAIPWLISYLEQLGTAATPSIINFCEANMLLVAQFCLFSPLMTLYLFRFLNRRDSSDFYHSMPHTRETLHGSYFCAVEFWNVLTTLCVSALVLLLYGAFGGASVNMASVLPFLLNMLAAQLFVAAAVLLAMSITGTSFSNVMVALMIIFVPRIFITMVTDMIQSYCCVIDIENLSFLLHPSCNVAAGLPICVVSMDGDGILTALSSVRSGVYTLVLALLYLAAALFLLHRRQSETATKASAAPVLQAVYRIVFGAVLGLVPLGVLFDGILSQRFDVYDGIGVITLILVIGVLYFLFELISTKRVRNLVRAIPGFFLFIVIDGLVLAGVVGISQGVLSYQPKVQDIDSVSIVMNEKNYFSSKASSIALTDPQIKEIAADSLADTLSRVQSRQVERYEDELYLLTAEEVNTVELVFRQGNRQYQRYVMLSDEDYDTLVQAISDTEEYRSLFYRLPEDKGTTVSVYGERLTDLMLTDAQRQNLLESYKQEMAALSFEEWYPLAYQCHEEAYGDLCTLQLETSVGQENFTLYLPVTDAFPKTRGLFLSYCHEIAKQILPELLASLDRQLANNGVLWEQYSLDAYPLDDGYMLLVETREEVELLRDYLKNLSPDAVAGKPQMIVSYYDYYAVDADYYSVLVPMDEQALAPILEKVTDNVVD